MRDWKAVRAGAHLPFLLLIVGCVDLTLAPTDEVWDGAYFRTLGDFRAATIGIYDQIALADWYGRSLPLMADIMERTGLGNVGTDVLHTYPATRRLEQATEGSEALQVRIDAGFWQL